MCVCVFCCVRERHMSLTAVFQGIYRNQHWCNCLRSLYQANPLGTENERNEVEKKTKHLILRLNYLAFLCPLNIALRQHHFSKLVSISSLLLLPLPWLIPFSLSLSSHNVTFFAGDDSLFNDSITNLFNEVNKIWIRTLKIT